VKQLFNCHLQEGLDHRAEVHHLTSIAIEVDEAFVFSFANRL